MADLASIIGNKAKSDQEWKAQRQAERESVNLMRDAAVTEITSNPQEYARYLDMQGDNPTYSPGNIAMVMIQNPEATRIGTVERWRQLGRSVMSGEMHNGAQIFCRNSFGKGYTISNAYDVQQTTGRPLPGNRSLQNDSPEMEKALATLINYTVVPVETAPDLNVPARYDDASLSLKINPNYPDNEAFAAIATEIALVRFHAKGAYEFNRAESLLDAQSISYILCRRFGIEAPKPDISGLADLYAGWTPQERRGALDNIQNMSKQIGNSIEHKIAPPQKTRAHTQAPVR